MVVKAFIDAVVFLLPGILGTLFLAATWLAVHDLHDLLYKNVDVGRMDITEI